MAMLNNQMVILAWINGQCESTSHGNRVGISKILLVIVRLLDSDHFDAEKSWITQFIAGCYPSSASWCGVCC